MGLDPRDRAQVDLAGSEWAADRQQHSAERQREGAEINSSLMTLKACMRAALSASTGAAADGAARLPYRQHALTKLLKQSFGSDSGGGGAGRTLLLATLSPSSAVRPTMRSLTGFARFLSLCSGS